ncbi:hypothetical protein V6Z11_D08G040200 [Gossypium hirsutum]
MPMIVDSIMINNIMFIRKPSGKPLCCSAWAVRALSHIDSLMWIIQGTLAWRTYPRIDWAIQVKSNVDPTFYSLAGSGRSGGNYHCSSLLDNPFIPYQLMDNYLSSTGLYLTAMGK